jgi:hypothetical protein
VPWQKSEHPWGLITHDLADVVRPAGRGVHAERELLVVRQPEVRRDVNSANGAVVVEQRPARHAAEVPIGEAPTHAVRVADEQLAVLDGPVDGAAPVSQHVAASVTEHREPLAIHHLPEADVETAERLAGRTIASVAVRR